MESSGEQIFRYLVAGPCAAESERQLLETAERLHRVAERFPCPVTFFRAGVWKPRSSGADFSGAGAEALPWLQEVNRRYGFAACVEVARPQHIESCLQHGITAFWVGARTAAIGMAAGNALALLFCLIQGTTHAIKLNPENYFVSFVPVHVNLPGILLADAAAFAGILLLLLIPTLFISKVDPAQTVKAE